MLPKKKRVNKTLFSDIIAKGAYAQSPHFTLRYLKAEQDTKKESSRFSFVAAKKVAKSAVERNALRRRGYSALADVWSGAAKTGKSPLLALIFIKKGTEDMKFSEYKEELSQLLSKLV